MKRTKKLVSGLLVLMMLAGLAVMPAGAAEDAAEYVVNGDFEKAVVAEDGTFTLEGWTAYESDDVTASIVQTDDEGYAGYVSGSVDHGQYLQITQQGKNTVAISTLVDNLQAETPYEVSMRVLGAHDGIRFDMEYLGITDEDKATYNPALFYEKNTGTRYYIWNGTSGEWKNLKFNLILPKGGTGVRLHFRSHNTSNVVCIDDLSVKKTTNMISSGDMQVGYVSHRHDTPAEWNSYSCGYEYWFGTNVSDGSYRKAEFGSGYGVVLGGSYTLDQYIPIKNNTLYALNLNAWGNVAGRTLKAKLTFAEDTAYTEERSFVMTASSNSKGTAYIYIDGNFMYNDEAQSFTEAKLTLYADASDTVATDSAPKFWVKKAELIEIDPASISFAIGSSTVTSLPEGTSTLKVTGQVANTQYGGVGSAKLFVGIYDGNKLESVDIVDVTCATDDYVKSVPKEYEVAKGKTVKAFLWNSVSGLAPVCSGASIQ